LTRTIEEKSTSFLKKNSKTLLNERSDKVFLLLFVHKKKTSLYLV